MPMHAPSASSASTALRDASQGPWAPGVILTPPGTARPRDFGAPSLEAQVARQSHQTCRDALGRAFTDIQEAVEAAWVSEGFLRMLRNPDNPLPHDSAQEGAHRKWLSHYTDSQQLARGVFISHVQDLDADRLAQYDELQSEARALVGQGQRIAQQAALLHARANEKEKAARALFDSRPLWNKGSPENKDSKAPERHARDLAIFTMAGIVRPQNAECFENDCADVLWPAKAALSKDLLSQLKNATQQNVIFVDAQQKVMETILALKKKKKELNAADERGRTRTRDMDTETSKDNVRDAMEGPLPLAGIAVRTTDTRQGGGDLYDALATLHPDVLSSLIHMLRGRDTILLSPLTRQSSKSAERTVGSAPTRRKDMEGDRSPKLSHR